MKVYSKTLQWLIALSMLAVTVTVQSQEDHPACYPTMTEDYAITIPDVMGFGVRLKYLGKFTWAFDTTVKDDSKVGCSNSDYTKGLLTVKDLRAPPLSWLLQLEYVGYNKWRLYYAESKRID